MLNGVVTYTCVSGYEVSTGVTTATATCMANRVWEPVPTCQRTLYKNSITAFIFSIYTATRTKNSVDYIVYFLHVRAHACKVLACTIGSSCMQVMAVHER